LRWSNSESDAVAESGLVIAPWPPRARKLLMMLSAPAKPPVPMFASAMISRASDEFLRDVALVEPVVGGQDRVSSIFTFQLARFLPAFYRSKGMRFPPEYGPSTRR